MKKLCYLFLIAFALIAVSSCTNDEGEQDVELLNPNEETQQEN